MTSDRIPSVFADIRPYAADELPAVLTSLLADGQFMQMAERIVPHAATRIRAFLDTHPTAEQGGFDNLEVQKAFFYPLVEHIIHTCSDGIDLSIPAGLDRTQPHTFITNHRDIVLDAAFLSYLLVKDGFPTTVEIAIGDNLLIYPWIRHLVRVNKSFIVQRSLPMRELLQASRTMSEYMHFAVGQMHDNIWIAQREGRAKDSDDRTQEALLKMMALGGEGSTVERLRQLHLTPMALSYELDPCDYLKAREFQLKRDNPGWKKSPADDLQNMHTGIFGRKGRIHFEATECLDAWLATLDPATPRSELFALVAQRIDSQIHSAYRLYPINYIAADCLDGESTYSDRYTEADMQAFDTYMAGRLSLIDLEEPDEAFLRHCLLTMYANPVRNHAAAMARRH